MSLICTTTPGKTFTDETLSDSDFDSAASPGVSISDGSFTASEIDISLYSPMSTSYNRAATININCIKGRQMQFSYIGDLNTNAIIKLHGVENGMFGIIILGNGYDAEVNTITGSATGFTDYHVGGGTFLAPSPNSVGSRHIILWWASDMVVTWGKREDFT